MSERLSPFIEIPKANIHTRTTLTLTKRIISDPRVYILMDPVDNQSREIQTGEEKKSIVSEI